MAGDSQSRKWQITINNPADKGYSHDRLKEILSSMKSVIYWCMADEIGENGTYHTHLYLQGRGGINFSTIKKRFEGGHFEMAKGTASQNRDYVMKSGKWEKDKKHETQVPDTIEEWGEMPVERQGARNDLADLYSMLKSGMSDYDILEQMPDAIANIDKLDKVRQILVFEEYRKKERDVCVTYIYGDTGTGKTRGIFEKYGYDMVYRVVDYKHPFDSYRGQQIIMFDEFRSSIRPDLFLQLIDRYPVELPCRYNNKHACWDIVYIVTNVPLSQQYKAFQSEDPAGWLAFLRRINCVMHYTNAGIITENIKVTKDGFYSIEPGETVPFESNAG